MFMKLKKYQPQLDLTIQDVSNARNAQDLLIKVLQMLAMKKIFIAINVTKKNSQIQLEEVDLDRNLEWKIPKWMKIKKSQLLNYLASY